MGLSVKPPVLSLSHLHCLYNALNKLCEAFAFTALHFILADLEAA